MTVYYCQNVNGRLFILEDSGVKICKSDFYVYIMLYLCISRLLEEALMFLGLCSLHSKSGMDAALEAMHTRTYALLRWRINKNISQSP